MKKLHTSFTIHKARHGDCILIKTCDRDENEFVILIDGGPSATYDEALRNALSTIKVIDLLILTHIDSDHIGGLIKLFRSPLFKKLEVRRYWLNAANLLAISTGTDISLGQAKTMEELLIMAGETPDKYLDRIYIENADHILAQGIKATILSPDDAILNTLFLQWDQLDTNMLKPATDVAVSAGRGVRMPELTLAQLAAMPFKPEKKINDDIFNSSSIAFILECIDCKLLFLGDARPEVLVAALKQQGYNDTGNKLKVDFVKISHHGSRNNTSTELLDMIDCTNYIISTNGGAVQHKHPDRDVIARIVYHPARDYNRQVTIFFNYSLSSITSRKGALLLPADTDEGNWAIIDDVTQFPC